MPESSPSSMPEQLEKSHKTKQLSEQKAQAQIESSITKGEAFLCAIGYISFLCILPLVLLQDSKFGQFHGKQALVLAIFLHFLKVFQIFPFLLASTYSLLELAIVLISAYMAFQGRYFRIPLIYPLSEKFDIRVAKAHSEPSPEQHS